MDRNTHSTHPAKRQMPRLKDSKSAGTQVDAAFILGALRRWTLVAIPLALIFAAAGGGVVYLLYKPEYQSTAGILVRREKPYLAFQEEKVKENYLSGEVEILKSPLVFVPLVKKVSKFETIKDMKDPAQELAKQVKVVTKEGSELVTVSFVGPNAEEAQKIVSMVVEQYIAVRKDDEKTEKQAVLSELNKYKNNRQNDITALNDSVRKLAESWTGRDPFLQQLGANFPAFDPTSDLESRVNDNSYSQRLLEKDIELLEADIKTNPLPEPEEVKAASEDEILNRLNQDPLVVSAKKELRNAEAEYEQSPFFDAGFGEKHPAIRRFLASIKEKKENLSKTLKDVRPRIELELKTDPKGKTVDNRQIELEDLKKQLRLLQFGEQFLRTKLEDLPKKAVIGAVDVYDFEEKREELRKEKAALELISARIFALETENSAPDRISTAYDANLPLSPVADVPYKTIGLAGLFGLCLPFGLAVLWEIKVRRFSNTDQITEHFDTPIVAEVANLPRRALGASRHSNRLSRELRVYEESVDSLRTNLLLALRERNLQVIAVTSSISGEGKTSLATQLSISIAKAIGKPTLLVDGDMRAPDIHRLFEVETSPGLAEVLAGKCELEDAIVESSVENLDVLPAGLLSANPAYLLSNGSASKFFKEARENYEYVILDTPPILSANESMLLADAADGTLFCVMRDTSRYAHAKNAWQRINTAGGQMVGVVFNNVPAKNYIRTYGSYDYQLD